MTDTIDTKRAETDEEVTYNLDFAFRRRNMLRMKLLCGSATQEELVELQECETFLEKYKAK